MSDENANSNNQEKQVDYNKENRVNLCSKSFLDKTINEVLSKINESEKRIAVNNINLDEFDSGLIKNRLSQNLDLSELTSLDKEISDNKSLNDRYEISNEDNQSNKFTRDFLSDRVRNTITALSEENNNKCNKNFNNNHNVFSKNFLSDRVRNTITALRVENNNTDKNNLDNKCSVFSKIFFTQNVCKIITNIKNENQDLENRNNKCSVFSKNFFSQKLRTTITKIENQEEIYNKTDNNWNQANNNKQENKKKSITTPIGGILNEFLRKVTIKIDEIVDKKMEAEKMRKSELIENKVLSEKLLIENEIEISRVINISNCFWRKSCNGILQTYNEHQEKLVKYVIKIQKNFRRHLWMFIIKLEVMNMRIIEENERAIAASKKRKRGSVGSFSK